MQLQFAFFDFFGYAVTVSKFSELFSYAAAFFFLPELILHKYSVEGYSEHQKERNLRMQWNQRSMRYTSTRIPTHQDTDEESCSVKRRRGKTLSIERRATLSDRKRRANLSVRIRKVYSSQRAKSFAWRSRCRSRISCRPVPISKATKSPSVKIAREKKNIRHLKPLAGTVMEKKIGRGLVARWLREITQLGMSLCSPTITILHTSICRRQKMAGRKPSLAPMPLINQLHFGCAQRGSVTKVSNVQVSRRHKESSDNCSRGESWPCVSLETKTESLRSLENKPALQHTCKKDC